MAGSVREYAILYVGGGKAGASGGVIGGGNAITATPQHALDGFEHTAATTDPTRLDATSVRHGLLPALSGNVDDALRGDGTWGAAASPASTVTGPDAFGAPAVVGTSLLYARADHDHGLPVAPAEPPAADHEHVMDCLFSGDGVTTAWELPAAPFDASSVAAYVAGVLTEVTLSGAMLTTATFGSAPASAINNIRFDIVAAVV